MQKGNRGSHDSEVNALITLLSVPNFIQSSLVYLKEVILHLSIFQKFLGLLPSSINLKFPPFLKYFSPSLFPRAYSISEIEEISPFTETPQNNLFSNK